VELRNRDSKIAEGTALVPGSATMITRSILKVSSFLFLAVTLVAVPGCGGGGKSDAPSVETSQLEAKAKQGDAAAAMSLAEKLAAKTGSKETQIEALKWFHIASRLGNANARMGVEVLQKNLSGEDVMEAERRAAAFKVPAK
jgi:hypothetical protein